MWLCTNRGFYSIVEKEWDKVERTLTVRTRRLSDLESFLDLVLDGTSVKRARYDHGLEAGRSKNWNHDIEIDDRADYRYRARVMRHEVERVVMLLVLDIDYGNFKSSVSQKGLHDHASAYSSCWSAIMRLQNGGRYNAGQGSLFSTGGGRTGTTVAAELGYTGSVAREMAREGAIVYDEDNQVWFGPESSTPALCPHCSEAIDRDAWAITGMCDNCDSALEECEFVEELPACSECGGLGEIPGPESHTGAEPPEPVPCPSCNPDEPQDVDAPPHTDDDIR